MFPHQVNKGKRAAICERDLESEEDNYKKKRVNDRNLISNPARVFIRSIITEGVDERND